MFDETVKIFLTIKKINLLSAKDSGVHFNVSVDKVAEMARMMDAWK